MTGCSMATPHVTGLAATLLQHYPDFRWRSYLLRAHLMASSILYNDLTTPSNNSSGGRNDYGLGRVSSYVAHWARNNPNGWATHSAWGPVTNTSWRQHDIVVPSGTDRLVVVSTWDEPAASAGASQAVTYDLDLWIDRNADCVPDAKGQRGEYASQSYVDNVEYIIINNPPARTYRLKTIPWNAPSSGLPVGMAAVIIRGDPTPNMSLTASLSNPVPQVGSTFTVTTTVSNPSYIASGVHLARTSFPSGLTLLSVTTAREDGVNMTFGTATNLTLGNIHESDSRSAVWTFRNNSATTKTISFRAWSENGGTRTARVTIGPPPTITSPTPGSVLPLFSTIFQWVSNGQPVTQYWLYVGSSLGGADIHNSGSLGTALSREVNGLPFEGRRVYVRLWYQIAGVWRFSDFTYTEATLVILGRDTSTS